MDDLLIMSSMFSREIHSKYFASRLILGIVVFLWSIASAVAFTLFYMLYKWISLIMTVMITTLIIVAALKLPTLNEKTLILSILPTVLFGYF
uniref:Uncharacterized protein n=1 Tax=Trichobilharzia regenti TaxID=157069 RepID=A0AA85IX59_TRIRE|nr:unnamed protein product [Trichobilharzia regenti]